MYHFSWILHWRWRVVMPTLVAPATGTMATSGAISDNKICIIKRLGFQELTVEICGAFWWHSLIILSKIGRILFLLLFRSVLRSKQTICPYFLLASIWVNGIHEWTWKIKKNTWETGVFMLSNVCICCLNWANWAVWCVRIQYGHVLFIWSPPGHA